LADRLIKVLIVDDELIVRKGLRATIPWERFDMEVVADAANGLKGWEAFVTYKPDVVITDIVMPKLNGLELALKVKEVAPETSVLLLSCHEDFAYAKQGLKLGASGYVLKTDMDEEEMESYLRAVSGAVPQEAAAAGRTARRCRPGCEGPNRLYWCVAWRFLFCRGDGEAAAKVA
jgi:two-component system response regulator YesN